MDLSYTSDLNLNMCIVNTGYAHGDRLQERSQLG